MKTIRIPTADGSNRLPLTPAEREFAEALQLAGSRRPVLGRAVEAERLAREELLFRIRTLGPDHPRSNEAQQAWRAARAARRRADQDLEEATQRLDAAIDGWAREASRAWSAA